LTLCKTEFHNPYSELPGALGVHPKSLGVSVDLRHDVLIVGSGMAGLRAAVELAGQVDVAVVSKVFPTRCHSGAAQGGITAALGNEEEDRWEWHMFDTVKGSDFLADQDAVEIMVRDAPRAIIELEHMGVPFSRNAEGKIAQRAFGGHTRELGKAPVRRACYASDRTGRVIVDTLFEQCIKAGVRFYPEFHLVDLLFREGQCSGAELLELATGEIHSVMGKAVLLTTGGCGKIFKTTSNCFGNTGDGLAVAFANGVPLEDMEFVQFHPTGIRGLGILLSEAARGEGGVLRNRSGERFMERYAPTIKDLAPRDIVSRSILREVQEGRGINGEDYVHLDLTALGGDRIQERLWEIASFARIYAGVDPVHQPIPVQPTCHYFMGGLPTDADARVLRDAEGTPVPGLFAAGECACVSVHGANRLGCNSLLDLVVFGRRAGKAIAATLKRERRKAQGAGRRAESTAEAEGKAKAEAKVEKLLGARGDERVPRIREDLQNLMMDRCSVFRDERGLLAVRHQLGQLRERFGRIGLTVRQRAFNTELIEALECEHLLTLASVVVESALRREESRGAHYREDFPKRDDQRFLVHTMAFREGDGIRMEAKPVRVTRFEPMERKY
jgi:succinate dehydrogenase / fumarate reductase, flavoprotein subunit